jgi:ABC-type nitrate/sulfonate/bicarbonate transport system substrate-binding protein
MGITPPLRICVIGAILLLSGSAPAQQKLREVTITLSSASLGPGAPRVAKELGLFEAHGLSVRIVPMDSGTTALAALISKAADAAMVGSATAITASARGQKIVSIANGYGGFATTMILAKVVADKLGVAANAPVADRLKAVDGLLIGTPEPTAGSTVGFKAAAATAGAAMRFTYLAQQTMPAALERGAIQGYLASAPYWAVSVANGSGIVWISGPNGELPPGTANVSSTQLQMLRETADADPDLVARFVDVFDDLHKAIDERPAEVKAATARAFPNFDPKLLDIVFPSESAAWNARRLTAADWAGEIDFAKKSGVQIPGIENVKPEALLYP